MSDLLADAGAAHVRAQRLLTDADAAYAALGTLVEAAQVVCNSRTPAVAVTNAAAMDAAVEAVRDAVEAL